MVLNFISNSITKSTAWEFFFTLLFKKVLWHICYHIHTHSLSHPWYILEFLWNSLTAKFCELFSKKSEVNLRQPIGSTPVQLPCFLFQNPERYTQWLVHLKQYETKLYGSYITNIKQAILQYHHYQHLLEILRSLFSF